METKKANVGLVCTTFSIIVLIHINSSKVVISTAFWVPCREVLLCSTRPYERPFQNSIDFSSSVRVRSKTKKRWWELRDLRVWWCPEPRRRSLTYCSIVSPLHHSIKHGIFEDFEESKAEGARASYSYPRFGQCRVSFVSYFSFWMSQSLIRLAW